MLCYVNSDIIFLNDFLPTLKEVDFARFLVAGQRWDLDLQIPLDFERVDWENQLRGLLARSGCLHCSAGIDYFAFTKDIVKEMPPFAVGRSGWDNWFIYNARSIGIPVIDATQRITAVHQNHDYGHVPKKSGNSWEGPESDRNLELMGKRIYEWNLEDADWVLCNQGLLKRPLSTRELFRKLTLSLPLAVHPLLEEFFIWQHRLRYKDNLRKL